ncbi:CBS domain-containing protein [Paraneptunicella aestuarii]|uniref:CBS domain-containing protein n=1 Tax=Paraneptunicella aestuarii TaxID=2831148 RepID=UPI001E521D8E|nr:CBS domain-containing protein [Paraneptunicella aestuarii]UAA40614.1 CBS domain-containing protein [Paraneptunicella aestuarii]
MHHLSIGKIMGGYHSQMHFIRANDDIRSAARKMLKLDVSALPVIGDEADIVGLLTSRDILNGYVSHDDVPLVLSVMNKDFVAVKKSDSIQYVANIMGKLGVHHIIVEHNGLVCGIVSSYDFLRLYKEPEETIETT